MLVLKPPKAAAPRLDPWWEVADARDNAAGEKLERLHIADASGRRIRTDLPPDMYEGAARDFGG